MQSKLEKRQSSRSSPPSGSREGLVEGCTGMPRPWKRSSRTLDADFRARPLPPRGATAAPEIQLRHAVAETAAALHIGARAATAAKHVEHVKHVVHVRAAREKRSREQLKKHVDSDMKAHERRHESMVDMVRTRGSDEVQGASAFTHSPTAILAHSPTAYCREDAQGLLLTRTHVNRSAPLRSPR